MEVELVHADCGGHLRWLEFQTYPTVADVIQRGIALLFEDTRISGQGNLRWPRECGTCGVELVFKSSAEGTGQAPLIVEFDGHTARHA